MTGWSGWWGWRMALVAFVLAGRGQVHAGAVAIGQEEAERLFVRKVGPLLAEKCQACHGARAQDRKAGLDLSGREGALRGGESGPALVPGNTDESLLLDAVGREGLVAPMPPKENDRLTAEQVGWLRQWIEAGAPWPGAARMAALAQEEAEGVAVATSGGQSESWTRRRYQVEDLWAYRPVARGAVPQVDGNGHPIDAFLAATRAQRGVTTVAPEADRRTWLRRVTFDLTGLPPSEREIESFLTDHDAGSMERLIDQLLASPHYGEQQARHWLDVVRYADTSGFSNDFERPNAWRYRDYVVRSFNADKPFDRFVVEQIAGDELDPSDPEMLLAVGYLRMGPWEHTGMTVAAVTRQQYLDDVTHHVGVSLLAQGLRCAACHDHKFDPVPTRDYYRMQAVFATTQFAEREVPFLPVEHTAGMEAGRRVVERRLTALREQQAEQKAKSERAVASFLKAKGVTRVEDLPPEQRPRRDYLGTTEGLSKTDLTLRKVYEKQAAYLERELQRFEPLAFSVYAGGPNGYASNKSRNPLPKSRPDAPVPAVRVLAGGSLETPGETVGPGVLSAAAWGAAGAATKVDEAEVPEAIEGRRLALARWITSERNPLTARTIVNRTWQQHFGRGLVATPNNFGKMGAKPTHPELLDWLARWFVEHGWSMKALHRLIVTSEAYRRSSDPVDPDAVAQADPRNELLTFYPRRRLAAEEIRDALLAISGELNPEMGGPGMFPELHWAVALQPRQIMGAMAPAYLPSRSRRERHRRTLYAFRYRTLPDPFLEVLNRPGSETSCERRDETTVTPQVFAMFQSEFAAQRALATAVAIAGETAAREGRVKRAFERVYGRGATEAEMRIALAHLERAETLQRQREPRRVDLPRVVERSMVEELTGETVTWEEELAGLEGYERDLMPWEVGAETRALADLCLVLFNSNEFVYVR